MEYLLYIWIGGLCVCLYWLLTDPKAWEQMADTWKGDLGATIAIVIWPVAILMAINTIIERRRASRK